MVMPPSYPTGVGVIIRVDTDTYILHERDGNAVFNPDRIAPFGGAIEPNESAADAAVRELKEELELRIEKEALVPIGSYESHANPGQLIGMFLLEINPPIIERFNLHEGRSVIQMDVRTALKDERVTRFTKEIIRELSK